MNFTHALLTQRPYRFYLLLNDFMNHKPFEISQTGKKVTFEYMGNATKFYTPDEFTTYHNTFNAITWMKASEINFKSEKIVYPLNVLVMPSTYEHGSTNELEDVLTGLAVLAKIRNGRDVKKEDVIDEIGILSKSKQTITLSKGHTIDVVVDVNPDTIHIIQSPLFLPLLKTEISDACKYVNSKTVNGNISRLNIHSERQKLKLRIGENRGVTTYDVTLFESSKGSFKEIKLDHRINK